MDHAMDWTKSGRRGEPHSSPAWLAGLSTSRATVGKLAALMLFLVAGAAVPIAYLSGSLHAGRAAAACPVAA